MRAEAPVRNPSRVLTREMEEAIQDCLQCHRVCLRTFLHLLTLETDAELADPVVQSVVGVSTFANCPRASTKSCARARQPVRGAHLRAEESSPFPPQFDGSLR